MGDPYKLRPPVAETTALDCDRLLGEMSRSGPGGRTRSAHGTTLVGAEFPAPMLSGRLAKTTSARRSDALHSWRLPGSPALPASVRSPSSRALLRRDAFYCSYSSRERSLVYAGIPRNLGTRRGRLARYQGPPEKTPRQAPAMRATRSACSLS